MYEIVFSLTFTSFTFTDFYQSEIFSQLESKKETEQVTSAGVCVGLVLCSITHFDHTLLK